MDAFASMGLSQRDVHSVARRRPALLRRPLSTITTNCAYLVGLGLSRAQVAEMLRKSPGWAALPLRELTVKWEFMSKEMRVRGVLGGQ
jgi:hypothetical protein